MKVVAIGASTGGPAALREVISKLPANLSAAVIVVQHLPAYFTKTMAARLGRLAKMPVSELKNGTRIEAGRVYVAPGGTHFFITSPHNEARLLKAKEKPSPSVDMTFTSLAEHFGPKTIGVILTGMGADGTVGARAIKQLGGTIIAQDEDTSTVYGMPEAVRNAKLVDHVVGITRIAPLITKIVQEG